ncbi:MAG: response regulator transcription factor [Deltaproteobacteria bacterium]|nr:MAG: response regulator transcription factor [Deltaproteobacteria bacterium]
MTSIRILITDDHAIVREGLRGLIELEPEMEVCAEAENGKEAIELLKIHKPDVLLLDLIMPVMGGLETIHEVNSLNLDTKILVLTSYAEDEHIFSSIKAGALGYLLKDTSPQQLLQSIREVAKGESSLHPMVARRLIQELSQPADDQSKPLSKDPLSARELDVIKLVARGMSNQEISSSLNVSERTVRNHVSTILNKLHLANRTQAALYALREGIAPLTPATPPSRS